MQLRQVAFFENFSDTQIDALLAAARQRDFAPGELLFQQGDPADGMYILLAGEIQLFTGQAAERLNLALLTSGATFGELALIDGAMRSTGAQCLTACQTLFIDKSTFDDFLHQADADTVRNIMAKLALIIRRSNERVFQEELEHQRITAEMELERHRMLNQMVAGVAHEINTPLGIINTAASVIASSLAALQQADLPEKKRKEKFEDALEAAHLLQGNVLRAHKLVENFKKVSVNQLTDQIEVMDLAEAISGILDLYRVNAKMAKITFQVNSHLPPDQQHWRGYRGYLSQVLLNLCTNVERYAYPAGQGGQVCIDLALVQDQYQLTFRDSGKGIAPEHLGSIFAPFFTTGRAIGGTGLGMAIVHNIITNIFHGTVHVTSAVGQGTTFTITFPVEL